MGRELANDYLLRSGTEAAQAEVLSRILADMDRRLATKDDIRIPEARLDARLNAVETRLTWRMIAIIASLGTIISVVNAVT